MIHIFSSIVILKFIIAENSMLLSDALSEERDRLLQFHRPVKVFQTTDLKLYNIKLQRQGPNNFPCRN